MDTKKIHELLKLIEKHEHIAELSIEEKSFKFHVKFKGNEPYLQSPIHYTPPLAPIGPPSAVPAIATEKPSSNSEFKHIKSPIVGTFYSKSSPDTPPFVAVGDVVKPGTVVCIIESMKIFNEVESEIHGTIKQILVQDGSPIEHGQPLFVVE